ncbi:hypothetical protein KY284_020036 [Solanum tuberosum]|nr:hypothetical protein KY284_020036 [Solanum tuberosum]
MLKMIAPKPTETCKANAAAGMPKLNTNVEWIVDSGASHHITCCDTYLKDSNPMIQSENNRVEVPTGSKIQIEHIGDSVILGDHTLKNVLHVPDFKFNFLSVSKITKDLHCVVVTTQGYP